MAVFGNGFYPAYTTPYVPYYQTPMPQPQMQPAPQPVQTQQPPQQPAQQITSNIVWCQGESGAKSHLVAPNTTVALWDSEAQRIFLKSADAAGMPSMKILNYTIEETPSIGAPAQKAVNAAINPAQAPMTEYAGKAEQDAIRAEIAAYKSDMDALRAEMETVKGDLYGIAGKKSAARKKEAADGE